MPRFPVVLLNISAVVWSCVAFSQTPGASPDQKPDTRLEDALRELAAMRRTVTEQDRRIALLERTVRTMQTTLQASARRVPLAPSKTPENWGALKKDMSRAQVTDILGEPTSVDSVIDRQTLYYKDGNDALGTIVLIDDRVAEVASRRFQIYVPERKAN